MKIASIVTTFILSLSCFGQVDYYPATLIKYDGSTENVLLKTKSLVLENQEITIFEKESRKKERYNADQFLQLTAAGINIVTATIPEIDNKPVILRKLTNKAPELYEYKSLTDQSVFILKSNGEYEVLNSKRDGNNIGYQKLLFTNYNTQNYEANYFSNVKYSKTSIANYLNSGNKDYLLKQEPQVDFFEFYASGGYNVHTVNISLNNTNYDFNQSSANNFILGIKGKFNFDRIENKFSFIAGVNFQTINGSGGAVLFPDSVTNRRADENYDYNLQLISFFIGPMYNLHFDKFSISPYLTFEPTFLKNETQNLIAERRGINQAEIFAGENRDDSVIFNIGLELNYKNKYGLNFSYGNYTNLPILVNTGNDVDTANFDIQRLNLLLSYRIF